MQSALECNLRWKSRSVVCVCLFTLTFRSRKRKMTKMTRKIFIKPSAMRIFVYTGQDLTAESYKKKWKKKKKIVRSNGSLVTVSCSKTKNDEARESEATTTTTTRTTDTTRPETRSATYIERVLKGFYCLCSPNKDKKDREEKRIECNKCCVVIFQAGAPSSSHFFVAPPPPRIHSTISYHSLYHETLHPQPPEHHDVTVWEKGSKTEKLY